MANLIKDMDHSDMHKIIAELESEPCLYDPKAQYYKNAKKRKEAYERITTRVNVGASQQYTVQELMAIVKNLRQKYRNYRTERMNHYLYRKSLPTADKWWVMLHKFIKDENKFTQNCLVDETESVAKSKRRFDNSVKIYLEAEKRYMAELSESDEETSDTDQETPDTAEEIPETAKEEKADQSDGDAPAAKKSKTDEPEKRKPRYIEDTDDDLMDFLIYCMRKEPSLCDPNKSDAMKEEAYQRVAENMNEEYGFDGAYTVEDIKANVEIMRKYYRQHRDERLQQFEKKGRLPGAEKWFRELHRMLLDENKIEFTSTKTTSKAKMDKLIANYLKAEDKCW